MAFRLIDEEQVYSDFIKYFGDLPMTKIKDTDKHSMYAARIRCYQGIENRYIIVFVKDDYQAIDNVRYLSDLKWINFQTRSLADLHSIPVQDYKPRKMPEFTSCKIRLVARDEKQYVYETNKYPIVVTLIPRRSVEYHRNADLVSAIEQYSTIITFKGR